MPIYCFRNQADGEIIERVYPIGKAPRRIKCGGKHYIHDIGADHRGFQHTPGAWPAESDSLRVPLHQIESMREHIKEHTGFTPDINTKTGRVVFHDREHRARTVRAFRSFDMDAGYSDPAPR